MRFVNRLWAVMLAALMLCGMLWVAAAEQDVVLDLGGQQIALDDGLADQLDQTLIDADAVNVSALLPVDAGLAQEAPGGLDLDLALEESSVSRTLASGDVPIDAAHFPDDNFRRYVSENFDPNGTGVLSGSTRDAVTEINVYACEIVDLAGIEYFPALEDLNCSSNLLTSLNVSACTSLKALDCFNNRLTSLNVSGCAALEGLYCGNNQLPGLDLHGFKALRKVNCFINLLSSLDVSGCTALEELDCSDNLLPSLDVSNCAALNKLDCGYNQLTSLNLKGCVALDSLRCNDNQLTRLDTSGCASLTDVYLSENPLTSLNMSDCTSITRFEVYHNLNLTDLDISGCTSLTLFSITSETLQHVNLSGCKALIAFSCDGNQVTSLDVSGCAALTQLFCNENQLESLDVRGCPALQVLYCHHNKLKSLDLTKNTKLTELYCEFNQLTKLNLAKNTKLKKMRCPDNSITKLDITNCPYLKKVIKKGELLTYYSYVEYNLFDEGLSAAFDKSVQVVADGKTLYPLITPVSIEQCTITGLNAKTYTGDYIKPAPVVKYGDVKLKKNTDYTVSYANNKNIGTATVTIKGKGNYTGSVKKYFKINPKAVALSSLVAGKNQLTVKWKKGAGGVGYELQYSLKKNFSTKKTVTIAKNATVKQVLKNLTTGKTYYVRIRAIKKVKGKKYVSAWSKTLSKKVK